MNDNTWLGQGEGEDASTPPLLKLPDHDPPDPARLLRAAIEQVRQEAFEDLDGFAYALVTQLGSLLVDWKESLVVAPERRGALTWPMLEGPWFKVGAELALIEVAINRAILGFERLHDLKPVATPSPFPDGAVRYLREVTQLFLLGFDVPCISFCGAAAEQLMKQALVKAGHITEQELRSRKMSGGDTLELARSRRLVVTSATHVSRILHERDRVMHRHLWNDRVIRAMAATAVADLTVLLTELARSAPEGRSS